MPGGSERAGGERIVAENRVRSQRKIPRSPDAARLNILILILFLLLPLIYRKAEEKNE